MASAGGGDGSDPEFQIAPMIDVLLVMLIFFMSITTDQVMKIDKSISLPVAPEAKKRENDMKNQAVVNIDWDTALGRARVSYGDIVCDPLEQLKDYVEPAKAANSKLKMIIRGDAATPALEVQKVIEQLAASGIDDISLSGMNRTN
ncbi:biopolymer transporter ExbD [Luteolibacter arcticus]|uniref:Biopolymer transporter ExbD n=1 Tax=Luteolibacter arcticus TaxID=1581411 RepID=A0ABT3GGH7_9BACT|nr:biopolymer transporter ExbD [Luteolibacter arcticus]MCW1922368.1 biopolymer transporter ExbD [Luteolibacter arcticus]